MKLRGRQAPVFSRNHPWRLGDRLSIAMVVTGVVTLSLVSLLWPCTQAYITYIEVRLPLPGHVAPPGSPWPQPQVWQNSTELLTLDPLNFFFTSNARQCDVVDKALQRYRNIIFMDRKRGHADQKLSHLPGLNLQVENYRAHHCEYPRHGDDEKYSLEIPLEGSATIRATTVWGALRGLETFSQLVFQNDEHAYLMNHTRISDWPRYKFRGLLLDTSRHFQPKKVLKLNLDAMAYNKMNVFHWHLVDDQSWPFESKKFPNLTLKGAYSPRHVYTQKDIQEIIDYARLRGVRVIPEFDTPGHTQALGKAFPHLLTPCYGEGPDKPYTPRYPDYAAAEFLNPINNATYDFMKELFKEVKSVFKDEYLHLGMDEVYYACWNTSTEIQKFMKENDMTEVNEIEDYYVRRTIRNVKDIGYKYMTWQDPVDNDVEMAPDTIVGVWKDKYLDSKMDYWQNYIAPIAKKGYQMVLSACWYLNYISYGPDWKKYYECDPRGFNGTEQEKDLVIGGEACLWGEYVDGTNLLSRLWPRASAIAERLWSDSSVNNTDDANFRLDQQRCRMLRRGIPAAPILNGFCGDYEWDIEDEEENVPCF